MPRGDAAVVTGAPGHLSKPRPVTDADDGAGDGDGDDDDGGVLPRGDAGVVTGAPGRFSTMYIQFRCRAVPPPRLGLIGC